MVGTEKKAESELFGGRTVFFIHGATPLFGWVLSHL